MKIIPALINFAVITSPVFAQQKKDPDAPSRTELEVIELVNAERKKENLQPLTPNAKLTRVARGHSSQMGKLGKIEHEVDGKTPKDRVVAVNYAFAHIGENVAAGQRTPAEVMKTWMESEVHRTNILRKEFTEIGVGIVLAEDGKRYWTQVFGAPLKK
jgi:uncharacterized protein YkwD